MFSSRISAIGFFTITAFAICIFATESFSQTRSRLKAPASLLDVLDQEDRHCVNQTGLDRSVTVRSIQLTKRATPQILVRGSGLCLCGAQNCGFWVYRRQGTKYELLLKGTPSTRVRIARTLAKGYRDIVSDSHASAIETIVTTYRFDGKQYQLHKCVMRVLYDDNGNITNLPNDRPCTGSEKGEAYIALPDDILNHGLTTTTMAASNLPTMLARLSF